MELQVDDTEAEVLRETLESTLRDLRMEIAGTDNPEFRRGLRAREAALGAILTRLGEGWTSSGR